MDYVYFFVYFWLLLGIVVTIGVRNAFYTGQDRIRQRLETGIRILHPVLLFLFLLCLAWLYV